MAKRRSLGFNGQDTNLYRYVGKRPSDAYRLDGTVLRLCDRSGFLGIRSSQTAKDNIFGNCNNLGENMMALGMDALGFATPGLMGLGAATRGTKAAKWGDDLNDLVRRGEDTTKYVDDLADKVRLADDVLAAQPSNAHRRRALWPELRY